MSTEPNEPISFERPGDPPDQLLSIGQIASMLGLERSTISRWVSRGLLPTEKPRNKRLARRSDIVRLLAEHPELGHPKGTPRTPPTTDLTPENRAFDLHKRMRAV